MMILIFAKYPEPGYVNTRMVPPLTSEEAAALHRASLRTVCENVAGVSKLDAKLIVTPDERVEDVARWADEWSVNGPTECWPQGDGDLGHRLARATDRALAGGAQGVILLGADSPTLPPGYLVEATERLVKHDAVIGPTADGGYYVLGLRRGFFPLLEQIDWGTDRVARQTRQRAASAGVDLHELPTWYDLDRFNDLKRAAQDLAQTRNAETATQTELRNLIETLIERYDHAGTHETDH